MGKDLFNERLALRMHLESLLKLRHDLRLDYVDRDKVLSLEIKEVVKQVQAIEQKDIDSDVQQSIEEEGVQIKEINHIMPSNRKSRKEHSRINYQEIQERLGELLQQAASPMSLSDIVTNLEERHGIQLTNSYITIKKVTKNMSNVQEFKEGRSLFFEWITR